MIRCEKHQKKLEYICKKCGVSVCYICLLQGEHKGHEYSLKSNDKIRSEILENLESMDLKCSNFDEKNEEIKERFEKFRTDLTERFKELSLVVEERKKQVSKNLDQIESEQQNNILEWKNLIEEQEKIRSELSSDEIDEEKLILLKDKASALKEKYLLFEKKELSEKSPLSFLGFVEIKRILNGFGMERMLSDPSSDKVLLIATERTSEFVEDLELSIKSSGISKVTKLVACHNTPSIRFLLKFDAVVLYSRFSFQNPEVTGDLLAEFVERGGGLVMISYNALETNSYYEVQGRIASENFLPITKGRVIQKEKATLGKILDSQHPLIKDIKAFDGGRGSFRIDCKPTEGSKVIAEWSDGKPLIVVKEKSNERGGIVGLNFQPISDNIYEDGTRWDGSGSGSGRRIIANAVKYVISQERRRL